MTKVKVYSTTTCPWCSRAKAYLREKNVDFEDLNVGVDAKARQEMVEKSGQLGVPVIEINDKIIIGFDKNALDAELA